MNLLTFRNIFALFFVALIAAGCSTSNDKPMTEMPVVEDNTASDTSTTGTGSNDGLSEEELAMQRQKEKEMAMNAEMEAMREVRVFYFDFDKATIKPEARQYIRAHATYLKNNPTTNVVLNGYADERGTKEYNLALGERRAIAVRNFLEILGAKRGQMEVVSFGEEFPADPGRNEAAWALNRRVVLEY
jgi:peptidoglycan-associated lipoprotein